MEQQTLNELLITLEEEGVVLDREKIEHESSSDAALYSNLAVKILSIFGGLIGSFFMVLFILALGLYDSTIGLMLMGILLFGLGIFMSRKEKSIFLDTINISMWLTGVGMIGFGCIDIMGDAAIALAMIGLGSITFFLSEKFLLRFLAVLLICTSMVGFILENEWYNGIHLIIAGTVLKMTYLHLYESDVISRNKFFNRSFSPLRLALVFSLIGLLFLVGKVGRMNGLEFNYHWVSSLVIIAAILFSIYKIMESLDIEKSTKLFLMGLVGVIFIPTIFSPFIAGAILILILNYHIGHRTGIAIGVIALIYSVSQYYYDLNLTLLHKSGVLVLSGILFLCAYYLFLKKLSSHEQN